MATSGTTAQEFIQNSFSPVLGVLATQKVNSVVSKNNLSFVELLQPFTSLECEGQFREPNGTVCIVKNLKFTIKDVNWKPLQPVEARRQLNNAVLHNYHEHVVPLDVEGRKLTIPQSTVWFDAWREAYFDVQFPSDHEFTKHFLSCILVASTQDENIVDTFNNLNQQFFQLQSVQPPKLPKWFNSSVLKSYLLVHDASTASKEKATSMFEAMKQHLEANCCFMLTINSRSTVDPLLNIDYWRPFVKLNGSTSNQSDPSSTTNLMTTPMDQQSVSAGSDTDSGYLTTVIEHPLTTPENYGYDNANSLQAHSFSGSSESVNVAGRPYDTSVEVYGACMNAADIDAIKKFLQEYAAKALLPYIERQITVLSEAVANRKGVSRSLLSATKRWFGTGKGGNNTTNNTVIYSTDCPELQLRRLGDLWFMCGQWQRAFDTYHTAKREFYADGAWLCYAGALEMAALAAFMAGEGSRKTHGYIEESIVTYLNTCRMVQFAVRATLLSVLCLSSAGSHGEAAKQLIRMTSEDSDLRSAMLLEQAALCFLSGPGSKAMCRKYAFHIVLAGHRFSKAGQKKHAYRCYKQAYQVYGGSGWRLSTDHVQFALGRLAGTLRRGGEAAAWLARALAPGSTQPPHQHKAFLRDYIMAHQQWMESGGLSGGLSVLPLPLVEVRGCGAAAGGRAPLSAPGRAPATGVHLRRLHHRNPVEDKYWHKMEEMLLQVAKGSVPMIFKPTVSLFTDTTEQNLVVPQGEPIQILISLRNPLKIPLLLMDVELLWRFTSAEEGAESVQNEDFYLTSQAADSNVVCGQRIVAVTLEAEKSEALTFSLTPLHVGQLAVYGVAFRLVSPGEDGEGKELSISGKLELEVPVMHNISVTECAPCLQMTFSEMSGSAVSGELRAVEVEFRNVGPVGLRALHVAVSHPDAMQLLASDDEEHFADLYQHRFHQQTPQMEERVARAAAWRAACSRHVVHVGAVRAGGGVRRALLLRPRRDPALYLLAYYEPDTPSPGTHRLLRHIFTFDLTDAVEVTASPSRSIKTVDSTTVEMMNLVTEIKNISSEKSELTVEILEASLLSRQWQLTNLVAARDKSEALVPRERLHLVLEATRIPHPLDHGKLHPTSLKIAKGNPDAQPSIITPPYCKFVNEYKHSFIDDDDYFRFTNTKAGLIQSMVVVRWKVRGKNGREAIGQHCLWLDCFTKPSPHTDSTLNFSPLDEIDTCNGVSNKPENNVILFKIEHDKVVKHDFNESKLCLVPVTLHIVNCYSVPVTAVIDMSKIKECSSEVGWVGALGGGGGGGSGGALSVRVSLARLEARRVRLRAVCAAPGAFLLGDGVAVAGSAGAAPLAAAPAPHSLLIVEQA